MIRLVLSLAAMAVVVPVPGSQPMAAATDWVQLGYNAARTACTPDQPKPPFANAWVFDVFPDDRLLATVQVVTWKGKGFVGSKRGVLYAFNLQDGKEAWRFETSRAVEQTAAVADGKVIFGNMAGVVYALDAQTGKEIWKTDLRARGITNAPLLLLNRVYIGTRGGTFACLNSEDGNVLWRTDLGSPVVQSAAAGENRIFVTPDDMQIRALEPERGAVLWSRPAFRVPPPTLRGSHPVYWNGRVMQGGLLQYNEAHYLSDKSWETPVFSANEQLKQAVIEAADFHPDYSAWLRKYRDFLAEPPHRYSHLLMIHDAKTGEPLPPLPLAGSQCMATPLQAPAITRDGLVVYPQRYNGWMAWIGLFDLDSRELRRIAVTQAVCSGDETQDFSVGGDILFSAHTWEQGYCGTLEAIDLAAKQRIAIPLAPIQCSGYWKGAPPSNAVTIVGDLFMHVAADRVAAWRGKP